MAQTYAQIQKQIEQLQRQAEVIRAGETKGVIERIKLAIAHYSLTPDQLGFGGVKSVTGTAASAARPAVKRAPGQTGKGKGKPRFSDKSGNVWSGRGPHPAWLREALQAGHNINEFRIGNRAKPNKTLVPLASARVAAAPSATSAPVLRRAKVSYADDAGHSWSGMGPKPGWLKAAIEAGKTLADFAK
jgi:DNA-binding protein H-NS